MKWDEFSEQLTGSEHIVGFYDGEITVPFGEVSRFREAVVSVLTHELTHAIVAQQSDDRAPHWFQEGLAQRMELVERQENIFQTYPDQRFVPLTMLDHSLGEMQDRKALEDAYVLAGTVIRFLEDRYGRGSIRSLIASFHEGDDTDEALRAVVKVRDMAALDREFRRWGLTHAGAFIDSSPWPYWDLYSPGIDPAVRNAIQFTHRPPQ